MNTSSFNEIQMRSMKEESSKKNRYPSGLLYIIGNEAAERFSYYGVVAILQVFLTEHLRNADGQLAVLNENDASMYTHYFKMGVYLMPIFGALLADVFLGKYLTIMLLSLVYCFGHFCLSINETLLGISVGLAFLSVGSGGIKSCTAAHVGDQFDESNQHLMGVVYDYFYMAINSGAALSMFLTPYLLSKYGSQVAFGVPGVFMVFATLLFFLGRNKFIAIPPVGMKVFFRDVANRTNLKALGGITVLFFVFLPFFWALFDQMNSTWVTQMKRLDNSFELLGYSFNILPSQLQAFNPVYILLLAPLFTKYIYPLFNWTALQKINIGFYLGAFTFVIIGLIELALVNGYQPSFVFQAIACFLLTAAEVMVSITVLEYAYRRSPKVTKSLVMGLFYLSIFLGNFIIVGVLKLVQSSVFAEVLLKGAGQFFFFALLSCAAAILLRFFRSKSYLHDN